MVFRPCLRCGLVDEAASSYVHTGTALMANSS